MHHIFACGFDVFGQLNAVELQVNSFLKNTRNCCTDAGCQTANDHTARSRNFPTCASEKIDAEYIDVPSEIQGNYEKSKFESFAKDCKLKRTHNTAFNSYGHSDGTSQEKENNQTLNTNDNNVSSEKHKLLYHVCSLPESIHLDHVEITWSRIGITLISAEEDQQQQCHTLLCGFPEASSDASKPLQLHGCKILASNQSGFLLQRKDELLLAPLDGTCIKILMVCRTGDEQSLDNAHSMNTYSTVANMNDRDPVDEKSDAVRLQSQTAASLNNTSAVAELLNQHTTEKLEQEHGGSIQTEATAERRKSETFDFGTAGAFVAVSGTEGQFVASYDDISVGMLAVDSKTVSAGDSCLHSDKEGKCTGPRAKLLLTCLDSGLKVTQVSCGLEHCLFLTCHGSVLSCGSGGRGQLGHGLMEKEETPRIVETLEGVRFIHIAAGGWHSTAVNECGDLYVWGWNVHGQLGLPTPSFKANYHSSEGEMEVKPAALHLWPQHIPVGSDQTQAVVQKVACGTQHMAVLTEDREVYSTGWNKYYQLGHPHNTSLDHLTPVRFTDVGRNVVDVWCGAWNSVFVLKDG